MDSSPGICGWCVEHWIRTMQRFRPGEREPYVRRLRDKAIEIVETVGHWRFPIVGDKAIPTRGAEYGMLSFLYTTPFQKFDRRAHKMPTDASDSDRYNRALLHKEASNRPVSFILDVWFSGKKVFSVAWDQPDTFEIVTFKRGQWENMLLSFSSVGFAENGPNERK
jgi:hypothetical protein